MAKSRIFNLNIIPFEPKVCIINETPMGGHELHPLEINKGVLLKVILKPIKNNKKISNLDLQKLPILAQFLRYGTQFMDLVHFLCDL